MVLEAHLIEQLCKDDTQRAQTELLFIAEECRVALEDILVHLEDHGLVLPIFVDAPCVLFLEKAVRTN